MNLLRSLQSEWLKTRRSAAAWLCLAGGFFLPLLFLAGFLLKRYDLNSVGSGNAWIALANQLWHFMGIPILPVGIVLAASLILQLEYRSNGWKQLHVTPQRYSTIFSTKLLTLVLITLKFFVFFNAGMLLAGTLPTLLFSRRLPDDALPLARLLNLNANFFIACMPVMVLQYLFSLLFRNFLISVGIGLLMVIGALILIETWDYAWLNPYCFCPMLVLRKNGAPAQVSMQWMAAGYSVIFTLLAFLLYRVQKAKG